MIQLIWILIPINEPIISNNLLRANSNWRPLALGVQNIMSHSVRVY